MFLAAIMMFIRSLHHLEQHFGSPLPHFVGRRDDCRRPRTEEFRPVKVVKPEDAYVLGTLQTEILDSKH